MKIKLLCAIALGVLLVSCSKKDEVNVLLPATLKVKLVDDTHYFSNIKVRLFDSYEIGSAVTDDLGFVSFNNLNYATYNVVVDSVRIGRFLYHPSQGIQMAGANKELVLNVKAFVYSAEFYLYKLASVNLNPISPVPYSNYQVLIVPSEKVNDILFPLYPTQANVVDTLCNHRAIMTGTTNDQGIVKFSGIPIGNNYTLVLIENTRTSFINVATINENSVGYVLRKSYCLY